MKRVSEIKEEVRLIFIKVPFRKFGNAFRKHVDPMFKAEYNMAADGGMVGVDGMIWSELASYIIGDGSYDITQEQYENFIKEFK